MTSEKGQKEHRKLYLLVKLASLRAHEAPVPSSLLVHRLEVSKSTLSRWLSEAREEGSVEVERGRTGEFLIGLTRRGLEKIRWAYEALRPIFSPPEPRELLIEGELFTGMDEGAYYVTRKGYVEGFKQALGYVPYPGTLNLRLGSQADVQRVIEWRKRSFNSVFTPGFREGGRTFGYVTAFPAIVNRRARGHAVFAERRHYGDDVIEVIAPENLRKKLGLKDGDVVSLELVS